MSAGIFSVPEAEISYELSSVHVEPLQEPPIASQFASPSVKVPVSAGRIMLLPMRVPSLVMVPSLLRVPRLMSLIRLVRVPLALFIMVLSLVRVALFLRILLLVRVPSLMRMLLLVRVPSLVSIL